MKVVVHPLGRRYSLEEASNLSYDILWSCAKCGSEVTVPRTRKSPRMVHPTPGCDGVLVPQLTADAAIRASAFLCQNWNIYVENRSSNGSQGEAEASIQITLEKAQAFAIPDVRTPLVLVQSYYTAFIVGFGNTPQVLEELATVSKTLGCGVLMVGTSNAVTWAELAMALLDEHVRGTHWVALADNVRVTNKRKKFNQMSELNVLPAAIRENRKAEHYHPNVPQSRAQYLQDIVSDTRAQGWARWVQKLVLSRGWVKSWVEDFDEYPIQVPHFWLRYWLIKSALHHQGKLIDSAALAYSLASNWDAQGDLELLSMLEAVFVETLRQLEDRALVAEIDGKYYCKKSFR
jgi:hypothetical protein